MTNSFTLDALRAETIRRYAPLVVELSDGSTVELKALLRMKSKDREQILESVDAFRDIEDVEDEDDDELVAEWSAKVCETVAKVLRLIANSPRKLIAELDHEDPEIKASLYTAVLMRWIRETQVGEAESSPA
ncbi:tail assembly chaperone [Mycobacterium phage EagleEye]|uniref:Tail assembly chaperone n=1 Tax=Mycobacterium phage EagleEye TaxID=1429759 RepID=W0LJ45_9CAUD|nr:tail assembly chaperone [Mycobacterium phage EagleEye]AHG23806.1 tail assembly chaperone [Mycobacterium phage EagleEye]QDK03461.1 tail assembly chaperone [Mycobacterium phage Lucyedi]QNJ55818.1 tail assembly chaperone [Mycobacterium phage PainterBoy]